MSSFIIIALILITLGILTYLAYSNKNSQDFGITKILITIINIGFVIGLTSYLLKPRLDIVLFWILLPLILFYTRFGRDIPLIIRLLSLGLMTFWFFKIYIL